jgi:hypothetical protein
MNAQVKLFGKVEDLTDFSNKKLMVVLENGSLIDATIRGAIEKEWIISKYEFCSTDDFEKLKNDDSYYFLVRVNGIFKKEKEPALEFISLLKGGPKEIKNISQMPDIITLPLQPINDGSGYILPYIDSYVKLIQDHVIRIQRNKIAARVGISWYSNRLDEVRAENVLFGENDISNELKPNDVVFLLNNYGKVVDEDEIQKAIENKASKTLVSICIAPNISQSGSYCYKMLLSTDTNELYYYRKQKISGRAPRGFLIEDMKKIAVPFSN